MAHNMVLNVAPFGRWTLRRQSGSRALGLRYAPGN